ncbi:MAG: diadenylate cyclase CdaA [Myxococcota bacterium]|nr:diadenylate cyclase CdaA [Myxococcota bacterium]
MIELFTNSPLSTLRWEDLLDIALLTYIFYRVFLILRGTRAFQSLIGLLGLGIIYMVAQKLQLFAIHWVLESFFVYLVLAVLILFQNDIRRGLARAGGRFAQGFATIPEASAHEEVVRSAFALASRRIGAIMVIERGASLDDYAEVGHRLDAQVSQELLLALFHPTSPLHDGAVLVQSGLVTAAKVFLPLSLSKDIARYFGTRHRAALGLSEETDAVVIVVSEERGTVSLVLGGALTPVQDTNELRQRLQEIFQQTLAPTPVQGRAG